MSNIQAHYFHLTRMSWFQTFAESERRHWECMENEWEREKQKILNALLGSGQDSIDFQPETEVRSSMPSWAPDRTL